MANIKCGHCSKTHASIAVVRACAAGNVFQCYWLVERWAPSHPEDAPELVEENCGADAIGGDDGWTCSAGHSHVSIQARHDQGWDYADEDEAMGMLMAGVEPVRMSEGTSYWDNTTMNPSWESRVDRAQGAATANGALRELHRAYND